METLHKHYSSLHLPQSVHISTVEQLIQPQWHLSYGKGITQLSYWNQYLNGCNQQGSYWQHGPLKSNKRFTSFNISNLLGRSVADQYSTGGGFNSFHFPRCMLYRAINVSI